MTIEFGNFLKRAIEQESVTQKDLADTVGLHHNAINRAIAGEYSFKTETAIKVAKALNIPIENRAKFFLLASGFPEELIDNLLGSNK